MENFELLGLHEILLQSLQFMKFDTPTPIQAQTIPHALEGKDILGSAQTGTGKTAAFGIPLVSYLLNNPQGVALVLTPTRELALQVLQTMHLLLGRRSGINTALLIGGDSMFKQLRQLKSRARLIVGTPGRVNDHLLRGTLCLKKAGFLVLDETDRMLDMGFSIQIQKIIKHMPTVRQTLMFSATMDNTIVKMAENYLRDAVRVSVGSTTSPIEKIKQETIRIPESQKYHTLLERLQEQSGTCIVFVKTKWGADELAANLRQDNHNADAIHGDLRQNHRDRVIRNFRDGRTRILVATDIAARGLDIPHIECVINFDLPQCPEDYIHRIGRTGRAGNEGLAINLVTSQDGLKWRNICRLINPGDKSSDRSHGTRSGQDYRRDSGGRNRKNTRPSSQKPRQKPWETGGHKRRSYDESRTADTR